MSDTHLLTASHKIRGTKRAWWYEESAGVCIVQEYWNIKEEYQGTSSVMIPWRALRGALARKDRPKGRKG